jgi:hypothetical protein
MVAAHRCVIVRRVEVRAEEDGARDGGAALDVRANADDRFFDRAPLDVAAVGMLRPISAKRSRVGFSSKATIWPSRSNPASAVPWVPVRVVRRLFRGEDLDEPLAEQVHAVRLRDVAVEGRRVELRQDENAPDVGVQAVADRDVDEAILSPNRHSGLRTVLGEREQARALTAAEDERKYVVVHGYPVRPWYIADVASAIGTTRAE